MEESKNRKIELGKRLAALRINRGFTQPQLGEFLETNYKNISVWETGKYEPDISTLISYAKKFNVSVDYLLGLEKEYDYDSEVIANSSERNSMLAASCISTLKQIIQISSSDTSRGGNEVMVSLDYLMEWLKTLTLQVLIENEAMKNPESITPTEHDRPVSFYYQKTVFALKEFMKDLMQSNIDFLLKKQETEPLTIKDMVDSINLSIEYSKIEKMTSELDTDSEPDNK